MVDDNDVKDENGQFSCNLLTGYGIPCDENSVSSKEFLAVFLPQPFDTSMVLILNKYESDILYRVYYTKPGEMAYLPTVLIDSAVSAHLRYSFGVLTENQFETISSDVFELQHTLRKRTEVDSLREIQTNATGCVVTITNGEFVKEVAWLRSPGEDFRSLYESIQKLIKDKSCDACIGN
ncbi:hypothetical protein [Croceimicrobium sp.]|uniref:hypothetical protein n=1 Tax=Croceimicrobium sp. TaxID=2828340 RepID=UPI003BA8B965